MQYKSTLQSVLICLFAVLTVAVCILPARALAASTTWIVPFGDWFDCTDNWSSGSCPDFTVDASIDNGGTAVIDHQVDNGNAVAKSLILGTSQGQSGSVTIDGTNYGALEVRSDCTGQNLAAVYVGKQGSGKVTVTNGGFILSSHGYIAAETSPNGGTSNGSVTLSGENPFGIANWLIAGDQCTGDAELFVGCTAATDAGGTALLDVKDGANVEIDSTVDEPEIKVGLSGTVTGDGLFVLSGPTQSSETASVLGTLAPAGTLTIAGNLALDTRATTVCSVTPQGSDNVQVVQQYGNRSDGGWGHATLHGRLSVTMTGDFSSAPTRFLLLHADAGLNETKFDSKSIKYPVGQGWAPYITYDYGGGNVNLDRVYNLGP